MRVAAADFVGADLGHASGDADDHVGPNLFDGNHLAEEGKGFVFGLFSDGAGVEKDDLGGAPIVGFFEPHVLEIEGHLLAVFFVHLAAPGLNEIGSPLGFVAAGDWFGTWSDERDVTHGRQMCEKRIGTGSK